MGISLVSGYKVVPVSDSRSDLVPFPLASSSPHTLCTSYTAPGLEERREKVILDMESPIL